MSTRLIYVGQEMYSRSDGRMSPLYRENGEGYNWNSVESDLRNGVEVKIRPATPRELAVYTHKLMELERQRAIPTEEKTDG